MEQNVRQIFKRMQKNEVGLPHTMYKSYIKMNQRPKNVREKTIS